MRVVVPSYALQAISAGSDETHARQWRPLGPLAGLDRGGGNVAGREARLCGSEAPRNADVHGSLITAKGLLLVCPFGYFV